MKKIKFSGKRPLLACLLFCLCTAIQIRAVSGDLDTTFGTGGKVVTTVTSDRDYTRRVRVQPDGKIVTLGTSIGNFGFLPSGWFIARHNADGSIDNSFGTNGIVTVPYFKVLSDFVILPNGKIMITGSDGNNLTLYIMSSSGSFIGETNINGGGGFQGRKIVSQPDDKLIAVGISSNRLVLVRYNADGSLDNSYGTNGKVTTNFALSSDYWLVSAGEATFESIGEALLQPDGKLLVAGNDENDFLICRFNSDGSLDNSFGTGGVFFTDIRNRPNYAGGIAQQSDGKIVINGQNLTVYEEALDSSFILRLNADGTPDTSFGTNGIVVIDEPNPNSRGLASALAIQPDGKILTAGMRDGIFALARYNTNGSIDNSFGANGILKTPVGNRPGFDTIFSLAFQTDGKLIAAGSVKDSGTNTHELGLVRYQLFISSNLTVTRSDDRNNTCVPGDCSLREAVNAANASATDDTINFASGLTRITLTNDIVINDAGTLSINGAGANVLTIDGGAGTNRIFYTNNATVAISDITLTGGNGTGAVISGNGGAIYTYQGSLTLDGVHVTGNTTLYDGGGVYFSTGTTSRIINSTISGNTVTSYGGGGFSNSGWLTVVNSTISGNTAPSGGGFENSLGFVTVVNSTISGNTASYWGGGFRTVGYTTLHNVTITNNTAPRGGGIYQDYASDSDDGTPYPATLNLGNTIVAGNISTTGIGPEIYNYQGISIITSQGSNLVGDSPGDSTNTGSPIAYQPTDIRDANPLLGALQNNGGTTSTHALLAGSPAIDKGINASAFDPSNGNASLFFDQRGTGFARIRDGNGDRIPTVDIGAFEVQSGATAYRTTPFDFDGDGKADISVFRPANGAWYLNQSTNGLTGIAFGFGTDKIVPADYDGDGKTDVAVYRDGTWYLQRSRDGFLSIAFGLPTDIPVPAEYSGDGKAEIAVFRPSDGIWYIYNLTTNQFSTFRFGQAGDIPVAADYDGDGKADVAVFRNGTWYIQRSRDGIFATAFGQTGDKPVPADYDGDGKANVAVFRPSNGTWYLLQSTNGFTGIAFGFGTDLPVPADYDGDGKADIAVFRNGIWYLQRSQSGFTGVAFGEANDKPIPNAFVP